MTEANRQVNLKEEAKMILGMIQETEEKYSAGYLIRLLKGDTRYEVRVEEHRELKAYGSMPDVHTDRLRNILRFLEGMDLIEARDGVYGILGLTGKGLEFLNQPEDLWVDYRTLRMKEYDQRLLLELREIRRELSKSEGKAPFRIFTDHMLENLIREKPINTPDLQMIPGFGDYKVNRYGPAILQAVNRIQTQKEESNRIKRLKEVRQPSYQATKSLFEAGLSEAEIAQRRNLKPTTVRKMLLALHREGEINLTPWIEQHLDEQTLEKGTTYFQQHRNPRLKEAYETLGLDYATLRLCRLYVAEVSSHSEEVEVA